MSIEFLDHRTTQLGVLCLRRRELLSRPGTIVTEVTLNHQFLMSSYLTDSERALATIGLDLSDADEPAPRTPLKVLVGGLGLGYTAAEALKSDRVGALEVVEFLPEVIGWLRDGLIPLAKSLRADTRLTITHGDVYARLASPGHGDLNLIVIDVDHSPEDVLGTQSIGFYSVAGLQKAMAHLLPGGVLGIWSYAEDSPLLANMQQVFADVKVHRVTAWNDLVNEQHTDWLFFGRRQPL
jgi:spermidine synthase